MTMVCSLARLLWLSRRLAAPSPKNRLELELVLDLLRIWLLNKRYIIWLSVIQRLNRGLYNSSEFDDCLPCRELNLGYQGLCLVSWIDQRLVREAHIAHLQNVR
jgi:hypothetical protein